MIEKIDVSIRSLLYLLITILPFSNSGVEICFGLILMLWVIKHLLIKSFKVESSILNVQIYLFIFIGILSVAGSPYFKDSLHSFFSKFMEGIILYFITVEAIKEKRHVLIVIILFLFVSVIVSIDGIIQYFFTGLDIFRQRPIVREGVTAAFDYPNKFAAYLSFPFYIMLGMFMEKLKVKKINLKLVTLSCALALLFFVFIPLLYILGLVIPHFLKKLKT